MYPKYVYSQTSGVEIIVVSEFGPGIKSKEWVFKVILLV